MQKKSSTMSLDDFKDMREEWRKSIAEAEIKRIQYLKAQNQLHRNKCEDNVLSMPAFGAFPLGLP